MTLNCCVYNDKMFQKDTMISANAYRCEILVCEEKVGHCDTLRMVMMLMYPEVGPGGGDRVQAPSVHRGQADVRLLFKVPGDNLARNISLQE